MDAHYHMSFKVDADDLIGGPITLTVDNCYAIATTRNYEMKMKKANRLPIAATLSIQEIMNLVPREHLYMEDGYGSLRSLPSLVNVWKTHGTVLAQHCPFTQDVHPHTQITLGQDRYIPAFVGVQSFETYEESGYGDSFEDDLEFEMSTGPVAVALPVYPSYDRLIDGTFVYNPTEQEFEDCYYDEIQNHIMLATCSGRVNNLPVLRCQDSSGTAWGDEEEFVAHSAAVNCLKIGRKSSRKLVTGGEDHTVNLWAIGKPNAIQLKRYNCAHPQIIY